MSTAAHPFSAELDYEDHQPLDAASNSKMWFVFALLVMCLTVAYWNMFEYTASFWSKPLYSHGWIVPLFAAFLMFSRAGIDHTMSAQEQLITWIAGLLSLGIIVTPFVSEVSLPWWLIMTGTLTMIGLIFYHLSRAQLFEVSAGMRWIGVAVLLFSLLVRLWAARIDMNPVDRYSFIVALIGIFMLIGGTKLLSWAWPAAVFIFFMFPLPSRFETVVLLKLQGLAAIVSTWTLQLLGAPAMRDGNKIIVDQLPLDVADACSGLRMVTIFGAMSVALAILMVERPWWDRLIIFISAIPVAIVTNVIRITITALLLTWFKESAHYEMIHDAIHDWAGFLMMPIAMGILWLELEILRKISVPIDADDYATLGTING